MRIVVCITKCFSWRIEYGWFLIERAQCGVRVDQYILSGVKSDRPKLSIRSLEMYFDCNIMNMGILKSCRLLLLSTKIPKGSVYCD